MKRRMLSLATYALSAGLGALALLYPFFSPAVRHSESAATIGSNAAEMPLMLTLTLVLCLAVLLYEVQGEAKDTKVIALLGVLVAINATLRFIENTMPGPGGFSPIFFLIILTGYIFGGRFGFLMGVLTMFVSALITGGVGPWLPGQMFTAGWVGLSAPLLRPLVQKPGWTGKRGEIAILIAAGVLWGLGYGFIMNLWFWPYITGPNEQFWAPGVGIWNTVHRYLVFYVATSLVWDIGGAAGNVLLIGLFGAPVLRALRRFQQRFSFYERA